MEERDLSIHPYRKRKFFLGLAEFFNEPPPTFQRIQDVFEPLPLDPDAASTSSQNGTMSEHGQPSSLSSDGHPSRASPGSAHPPESDSFEYVEFDRTRTSADSSASLRSGLPSQSSLHDSMQDSLQYLPVDLRRRKFSVDLSQNADHLTSERTHKQPTTLSARSDERIAELVDYYATDRYCEAVPCWTHESQSVCAIHTEPIRRPMLLFCLQALDEFIVSTSMMRGEGRLVAAARVARMVFASWWEDDVLGKRFEPDLVISDYISGRKSIPGVSLDVWRIIESCWSKYQQNYSHHQELHFSETSTRHVSDELKQWQGIRQWLQIFGFRPKQGKLLQADSWPIAGGTQLSSAQLELVGQGYVSLVPLEIGCSYWNVVSASSDGDNLHVIGQREWKLAFSIIERTIRASMSGAHVFSCGPFPRGAAFGSVIDVVVGLPDPAAGGPPCSVKDVVEVLIKASVVRRRDLWTLSDHRVVAMIRFKKYLLLLDVKAYHRPQSWFALLYFTGPETFSRKFFSALLKQELSELSVVDFDHIYTKAVEVVGLEEISLVDSEHHLFELIGSQYVPAPHRI